MSNNNIFYSTCAHVGMLDRLECQARDVIRNVSFPLSFNFKLLSVITDGTGEYQFLKAINSQGRECLPNLLLCPQQDWHEISCHYYNLSIEFRQIVSEFKFKPICFENPHPKNLIPSIETKLPPYKNPIVELKAVGYNHQSIHQNPYRLFEFHTPNSHKYTGNNSHINGQVPLYLL